METWIEKHCKKWRVNFSQGVQGFTLEYPAETKKEALWMKEMLNKAFTNFKNELLQLFNDYEARHFHSDYDGFNKIELYNDGSGSLRDPEGKIIFEFESLKELTQKLKE